MKVVFVLPGRGGGGGAHSVVQETLGLRRLGLEASIATTDDTMESFLGLYPDLREAGGAVAAFSDHLGLARALSGHDLAIATTAPSAHLLAESLKHLGQSGGRAPVPAYYVQDYEPLFFAPGSAAWQTARTSYSVIPGALLFAKTDWLCAMVTSNHGLPVHRVRASVDLDLYHPDLSLDREGPVRVCAMIRPNTPRRAPHRTARILARLGQIHGRGVTLTSFGCEPEELDRRGFSLSDRIDHCGLLARSQVADLLRASDLFLDLSDFQAFGRTALEGMACGCIPVLPLFGGAAEYVRHGQNGFQVDTRSDEAILAVVAAFLSSAPEARTAMRREAIATGLSYSIARSVHSEADLFARALEGHV